MSSLRNYDWDSIYESHPGSDRYHLVNEFYVPALERSVEYDRVAGYFDSGALQAAARGIEELVANGGNLRLIAGAKLSSEDKTLLERLEEGFNDGFDPETELEEKRLKLLAGLLEQGKLEIKIAEPKQQNWGIFHPKLGIFTDHNKNSISFEGSLNETIGGWLNNYERFKVHRSWIDGQADYVEGDRETFRRLWNDDHEYVDVHDLPEAVAQNILDLRDDDEIDLDGLVEEIRAERVPSKPTQKDKAKILADGALAPGGIHLAEEASTVTPWPHQRVVADTSVNTYPNGFLFCDQVGLGKTIETGLTLSRLGLTGELNSGLVLTPASLVIQWQEELWEKFNLNTFRYERGTGGYQFVDAFGQEHAPPQVDNLDLEAERRSEAWVDSPVWRFVHQQQQGEHSRPVIVLMSWHTARRDSRWNDLAPSQGTARTRDDVPASCRGRTPENREGVWDAVVVDEAHNAREGTNLLNFLHELRAHTHCFYLLTATPMQIHPGELYDLLALIDIPEPWNNRERFTEFFETRRALTKTLEDWDGDTSVGLTRTDQQTTLDGGFQSGLPTEHTESEIVFDRIVSHLELEDEAIARQRLLEACEMARAYGGAFDDYEEKVRSEIRDAADNGDLDVFQYEDDKIKRLLYTEEMLLGTGLAVSRNSRLTDIRELPYAGWEILKDVFDWASPVDACIHRNTRATLRTYQKVGLLDATVPKRNPKPRHISLSDETARVYQRIEDYTTKFYKRAQQSDDTQTRAIGFVMTTYRQRLTSSVYAIAQSLQKRHKKLQSQLRQVKRHQESNSQSPLQQAALAGLDEFDEQEIANAEDGGESFFDVDITEIIPGGDTEHGMRMLEEEIQELESFIQDIETIDNDPKIDRLNQDIADFTDRARDRVIVFTQYKDTMRFIRNELVKTHSEKIATYSGDGGEMYDADSGEWYQAGKERVKQAFTGDGEVDVLVCTDSASEGLNLQQCGALINYDSPWNPMRIEQRIGRIDRIGQEYEEVEILNYFYEDSIDTKIYDRLSDRIGLFEDVVGEMQPILTQVEGRIRSVAFGDESEEDAVNAVDADIDEQEQREEILEIDESLKDVETDVKEEVIAEARLDAWQSFNHPDVGVVGFKDGGYNPAYTRSSLKQVFVGNNLLEDEGVEFTPLADLDEVGVDVGEHSSQIYHLSISQLSEHLSLSAQEGTLAQQIAPSDSATAVTFSEECADEYPSLRFIAPGEPLFDLLVQLLNRVVDDKQLLISEAYGYLQGEENDCGAVQTPPWIVCTWNTDEGRMACLNDFGEVTQESNQDVHLQSWCDEYVDNRFKSINRSERSRK